MAKIDMAGIGKQKRGKGLRTRRKLHQHRVNQQPQKTSKRREERHGDMQGM